VKDLSSERSFEAQDAPSAHFDSLLKTPSESFDGLRTNGWGLEKISTKSVHAELVEACSAVFQQILEP
jgi:hypothetical protein